MSIRYSETEKKCPYCRKSVKYCIAETKAVIRTYCPDCLKDIEITWKERR